MISARKILFSSLVGLLLCVGAATVSKADPLVLSLTNANQFGTIGTTLTFTASAFNSGALNLNTDTINAGTFSFSSPTFTFSANLTPFTTNFLGQAVSSGNTLGPLTLFTLTIISGNPGTATGTVQFGYTSGGQQFSTNTVTWTVTNVPEPATVLLLGTGLLGVAGAVHRRYRKT